MQQLSTLFNQIERPTITARNAKEDLIAQIVARTDSHGNVEKEKRLAKRISLWVNRYGLQTSDLHYILKRSGLVRNFSAYVNSVIKEQTKSTL